MPINSKFILSICIKFSLFVYPTISILFNAYLTRNSKLYRSKCINKINVISDKETSKFSPMLQKGKSGIEVLQLCIVVNGKMRNCRDNCSDNLHKMQQNMNFSIKMENERTIDRESTDILKTEFQRIKKHFHVSLKYVMNSLRNEMYGVILRKKTVTENIKHHAISSKVDKSVKLSFQSVKRCSYVSNKYHWNELCRDLRDYVSSAKLVIDNIQYYIFKC